MSVVDFDRFVFFSSRRRHTRLQGDWSSDVCSSDLRCRLRVSTFFATSPERRGARAGRSEEHTSELQSPCNLVCRLLLEKKSIFLVVSRVVWCLGVVGCGVACECKFALCAALSRGAGKQHRAPKIFSFVCFFNDTATTEIYTLSLHDALPICRNGGPVARGSADRGGGPRLGHR